VGGRSNDSGAVVALILGAEAEASVSSQLQKMLRIEYAVLFIDLRVWVLARSYISLGTPNKSRRQVTIPLPRTAA
jgi:hypothetical protein